MKTDSFGSRQMDTTGNKMNKAQMINQFLLNKWKGVDFGAKYYQIAGTDYHRHEHNAYFFLRRELAVTNHDEYVVAKREGRIRHCKPYCGLWLDYTVNKEFRTFEAWVTDCGAQLSDVLYGTNRVHQYIWREGRKVSQSAQYVTLDHMLTYLGFVPPVEAKREVLDVEEILKLEGLTLDNLWVIRDGTPVQWKSFTRNA
jgi:hypothetical protein